MQYTQTSATELNSALNKSIFGIRDTSSCVSLVGTWGQAHKDAFGYMRSQGLRVLQRSIQAFLDGRVQHHAFVNSSNHNGVLSTNGPALQMLKFISASPSTAVCQRQVVHAAKIGVVKQNTLQTFCPRKPAILRVRTASRASASEAPIKSEVKSDDAHMQDMLVTPLVNMDTQERVKSPEATQEEEADTKPRKRRRKAAA